MKRCHLAEIHELDGCPKEVRDTMTDLLQLSIRAHRIFSPIEKLLAKAIEQSRAQQIVDLCSGGGGPWRQLHQKLGGDLPVRLTDKFPNLEAMNALRQDSKGAIGYEEKSIDATALPPALKGFRTLFASFHHFKPEQARAILADAVANGQGIAVFELTRRDPLAILSMLFSPLAALLGVPFLKPFRWSRLFWTYVLPLVPLVFTIDGVISCLRTYSVKELREMTAEFTEYDWQIGEIRGPVWPTPVTYLIGRPRHLVRQRSASVPDTVESTRRDAATSSIPAASPPM
jgi:hypothetical protein